VAYERHASLLHNLLRNLLHGSQNIMRLNIYIAYITLQEDDESRKSESSAVTTCTLFLDCMRLHVMKFICHSISTVQYKAYI